VPLSAERDVSIGADAATYADLMERNGMLHELLAHGGCDADAVKAEAFDRRIP
jgi:hypothetical protein